MGALALVNGKIVTVDERFSIAAAVAIEAGRITATGSSANLSRIAMRNAAGSDAVRVMTSPPICSFKAAGESHAISLPWSMIARRLQCSASSIR